MRPAAEHLNAFFSSQVQAFATELDQRARERFPEVLAQSLAAYGVPRDQMSAREAAFADALLHANLAITGEIVGLALRRSADLLIEALDKVRLAVD